MFLVRREIESRAIKASDELARRSRLSIRYVHRLNSAVQKVTGGFGLTGYDSGVAFLSPVSARQKDGTAVTKRRSCRCELSVLLPDACGWQFSTDSPHVLKLLCDWFRRHGHRCVTQMVADMPQAHVEVEQFINQHKADVVVDDVPMPYGSSWDLLDVIRSTPSLQSQPFVITTRNKRNLEKVVGRTAAVEIAGQPEDLQRLLRAVEAAGMSASAK